MFCTHSLTYDRVATLHFLITQICLANNLYTYTSIALFQLITYPDKTNVSICSMWIFPRSVPTYNHLLWSGRWMQVILLKTNYTISIRYQEVQIVQPCSRNLSITLHSTRVKHIMHDWKLCIYSIYYESRNFLMTKRNSRREMPRVLMTDLSLWNLRLCTTCGIFWRKFHKCTVSSAVADTNAPSLIKNCNCITAAHPSCLTCASTPGLPKLFLWYQINSGKITSLCVSITSYLSMYNIIKYISLIYNN